MFYRDAVLEDARKFDPGAVLGRRDELGPMPDDGVLAPVRGMGIGPAIGFQVVNAHRAGEVIPVNGEPVFLPGKGKLGSSREEGGGK